MTGLQLSDAEWLQLLDGEAADSALPKCCPNVAALRDVFVMIVRNGRTRLSPFEAAELRRHLGWVANAHPLTPLVHEVCKQIGFDPRAQEAEAMKYETG